MRLPRSRAIRREEVGRTALESFRWRRFELDHFPFVWHYHSEAELTLIVQGEGLRFVGDSVRPFAAGDCCLLGTDLPHTWQSRPRDPVVSVVIQFDAVRFGEASALWPEFVGITALMERARRGLLIEGSLRDRIGGMLLALGPVPPGSARRLGGLMAILTELAEAADLPTIARTTSLPDAARDAQRRLGPVLRHMHDHWREPISLATVAGLAGMTPSGFSRFFHRNHGRSFIQHLIDVRLAHVCQALVEDDASIASIAFDSGFNNLAHFNQSFRRIHGMSPRAYRRLVGGGRP